MNPNNRTTMLILAAGAAALVAAPLTAREPEVRLEGSYAQPLVEARPAQGQRAASKTVIVEDDGENKVEVTIEGDRVRALLNGEEVPAERVKRRGGRIEIHDEDGRVVRTLSVPGAPGQAAPNQRGFRFFALPDQQGQEGQDQPQGPGGPAAGAQPPVMVGITMSDADPGLLEALGLESGIRVDRVVEGLPAEKAGVRAGDIIVAADGKSPVTGESFRAALRGKKPGDTIELRLFRRGQQETVRLELAPFDAERLRVVIREDGQDQGNAWGIPGTPGMPEIFAIPPGFDSAEARRQLERAREEIRKAIEKVRAEIESENLQGRVREQAERLVEELARVRESLREQVRGFREAPEGLRFRTPGAPVQPQAPQAPREPVAPREGRGEAREGQIEALRRENRELREQIERMNGRFDELMKRLDEMGPRDR